MWHFTNTNHAAKKVLGLTNNAYCVIDTIARIADATESGWCEHSASYIAALLDISPRSVSRCFVFGKERGLIEDGEQIAAGGIKRRRGTAAFWAIIDPENRRKKGAKLQEKAPPPMTERHNPLCQTDTTPYDILTYSNTSKRSTVLSNNTSIIGGASKNDFFEIGQYVTTEEGNDLVADKCIAPLIKITEMGFNISPFEFCLLAAKKVAAYKANHEKCKSSIYDMVIKWGFTAIIEEYIRKPNNPVQHEHRKPLGFDIDKAIDQITGYLSQ